MPAAFTSKNQQCAETEIVERGVAGIRKHQIFEIIAMAVWWV